MPIGDAPVGNPYREPVASRWRRASKTPLSSSAIASRVRRSRRPMNVSVTT